MSTLFTKIFPRCRVSLFAALLFSVVFLTTGVATSTAHAEDALAKDPNGPEAPHETSKESPEDPIVGTVQVDPLTTAFGFVHLQIEFVLGEDWSIYVGPHLFAFAGALPDLNDTFRGVGAELGVRWFFLGGAPEGWWAQVRGVGAHLHTARGPAETGFGGYASALGGYTWIHSSGLLLAGGLGVNYFFYTIGGAGVEGLGPAAHSTIGFAF